MPFYASLIKTIEYFDTHHTLPMEISIIFSIRLMTFLFIVSLLLFYLYLLCSALVSFHLSHSHINNHIYCCSFIVGLLYAVSVRIHRIFVFHNRHSLVHTCERKRFENGKKSLLVTFDLRSGFVRSLLVRYRPCGFVMCDFCSLIFYLCVSVCVYRKSITLTCGNLTIHARYNVYTRGSNDDLMSKRC